jgi:hypothetical protein
MKCRSSFNSILQYIIIELDQTFNFKKISKEIAFGGLQNRLLRKKYFRPKSKNPKPSEDS